MVEYEQNVERWGIKLLDDKTIRKTASQNRDCFKCVEAIANHFIKYPDPMVVPVYTFKVTERPEKEDVSYGVYRYTYDMKRLAVLSYDEKKLISQMNARKYYGESSQYVNMAFIERAKKDYSDLYDFMKEVYAQNRYRDIHDGNFLKDEDESYKIIDIEGFIYTPLSREENNWIKR